MDVFIFIVLVIAFLAAGVFKAMENVGERIQTEDNNVKIDVKVIQLEDVPQGLDATIVCLDDSLLISTNGYEKRILHKDVIDITIEQADQILSSNSQFSMRKALTGTALLGGVGAVAGVSGKKEDFKMMVLSYKSGNDIEYMSFLQQYGKNMTIKAEANLLKMAQGKMMMGIKG